MFRVTDCTDVHAYGLPRTDRSVTAVGCKHDRCCDVGYNSSVPDCCWTLQVFPLIAQSLLVVMCVQGISAARQVFKRGRTSEHCSEELFIASGA